MAARHAAEIRMTPPRMPAMITNVRLLDSSGGGPESKSSKLVSDMEHSPQYVSNILSHNFKVYERRNDRFTIFKLNIGRRSTQSTWQCRQPRFDRRDRADLSHGRRAPHTHQQTGREHFRFT